MYRHITLSALVLSAVMTTSVYAITAAPGVGATNAGVGATSGTNADPTPGFNFSNAQLSNIAGALSAANATCNPVDVRCPENTTFQTWFGGSGCRPGANRHKGLCQQFVPNVGVVTGFCDTPMHCKAVSYTGLNGQQTPIGNNALNQLLQQAGQIIGQLFSGGGGSGGGGGTPGVGTPCTTTVTVSDPTLLAGNPCATYVPPVTSSACPIAGQVYSIIEGGCACPTGQTLSSDGLSCVGTPAQVNTCGTPCICPTGQKPSIDRNSCVTIITPTATSTPSPKPTTNCNSIQGSLTGPNSTCVCPAGQVISTDHTACVLPLNTNLQSSTTVITPMIPVRVYTHGSTTGYIDTNNDNTGTLVAQNIDTANNTATAGFMGADTSRWSIQVTIGRWCKSRPWSKNILGAMFGTAFFDGLCQWSGYGPVTLLQNTPAPRTTFSTGKRPSATTTPSLVGTSSPFIQPRVSIWAVPSSVTLGARSTIYWNTQGVQNCTETSPDGSFHANTLSGGASTVPITSQTIFSISCVDSQQRPVTDFVRVKIGL